MTRAGLPFLPYGRQRIDEEDVAKVSEVLRGDWLTQGPVVGDFEKALAERVGARFAAACCSGTAALHLAALALGLGRGDAVVVPSLTFLATANAMRLTGAEVVFADVDPRSGLMRAVDLEEATARAQTAFGNGAARVKAVAPVHLNGQCEDMETIGELARSKGLGIVEDACHAIGATYRSRGGEERRIGGCQDSDLAIFSFHPVKTIAMGEGGAATTNDDALHRSLLRFRNHGMVREADDFQNENLAFDRKGAANPWYYEMPEIGLNYRASDIHCALGLSQLTKLHKFVAERRRLAERYDILFAPFGDRIRPVKRAAGCNPAWHLYPVHVDFAAFGVERAEVMHGLRKRGIGSQVHYLPLHQQPYYRYRYGEMRLPGAEAYYERTLSLPLFCGLEDGDVDRVVDGLVAVLGAAAR